MLKIALSIGTENPESNHLFSGTDFKLQLADFMILGTVSTINTFNILLYFLNGMQESVLMVIEQMIAFLQGFTVKSVTMCQFSITGLKANKFGL